MEPQPRSSPYNAFKIDGKEYLLPKDFDIGSYVNAADKAIGVRHIWIPEAERFQTARCIVGCALENVLLEFIKYFPNLINELKPDGTSDDPEVMKILEGLKEGEGGMDLRRLLGMGLEEKLLDERICEPRKPGEEIKVDLERAYNICSKYRSYLDMREHPMSEYYRVHTTPTGIMIFLPRDIQVMPYIDGMRQALETEHPGMPASKAEELSHCLVGCTLNGIQERIIEEHKMPILIGTTPSRRELRAKISATSGRPNWALLTCIFLTERELYESFGRPSQVFLSDPVKRYCGEYQNWLAIRATKLLNGKG